MAATFLWRSWFHVLTDELAELHRTGKLPQTVKAVKVYLWTDSPGHRPRSKHRRGYGRGTRARLRGTGPVHDDSSTAVPQNAIPPLLKINGIDLNPAQVLRLMAQAVVNPAPPGSNPRLVLLVPSIFRG